MILLFVVTMMSTSLVMPAQLPDYHVKLFDERHGVYTYLMRNIAKDQNDFIWIVYRFKVQRFDGERVKEFSFDNFMYSIFCDDHNNVWAASRSEIFRFDNKQQNFVKIPHDTSGGPIIGEFLKVPGFSLVAHTSRGFYAFDSTNNRFKKIMTGPLSISKQFSAISSKVHGSKVFVLEKDTLYSIDIRSGIIKKLGGAEDVYGLYALNEDKVLVSSYKNFCWWYDFKNNITIPIDIGKELTGSSSYYLRSFDLEPLNDHEYIITTNHGPLLYNSLTNRFRKLSLYFDGKPLQNLDLITNLLIDNQKRVWAVHGYGLLYFRAEEGQFGLIRNYETDLKRSWDNNVRAFASDERGNLWLATLNGFAYYDLTTAKITPYQPDVNNLNTFSFPSVRGIAYDGKYVILGPTNRGVWIYDIKNKKYRQPLFSPNESGKKLKQKSYNDFIDHICRLKRGDYIISARDGFYFMSGKNFLMTSINFPGDNENGNFAFEDSSGCIWLGAGKGLYCLDQNLKYLFKVPYDFGFNVRCMLEIKPGEYLVGSKGIDLVKRKSNLTAEASVLNPYFEKMEVNLLVEDKERNIWVGTSEGLIRYDIKTEKRELFNFFDNIQGNTFNPRAYFLTQNGILFIGGYNGINYLIPDKVRSRSDALKVTLTKLAVNQEEVDLHSSQTLRFKHFQNSVELEFAAPYFNNPNRVQYRYWLKGADNKWIDNGNNNIIRFTSLAPGNYEFKAAASIDGEHWYVSGKTISFVIQLPFWKTWWFTSLVAITIGFLVYSLYKYQLNKRLEVERLRSRISRDLHDDIGSTLSSINILARSSLEKNKMKEEPDTLLLQKIQQRSQKTLDAMDDLIWNTKPENDSLESLVIRMREFANEVLEPAGITFTLSCPASLNHVKLNMQQKRNLYLIFKEAINNLAKYSNSKSAFIKFEYQRKLLQMIITDEGTGFTLASIKKGDGLENMQIRAVEMNAQLEIKSGKGQGTVIDVHVPV